MSTCVNNRIQTQSIEETMVVQKKQGIVTILGGSDFELNIASAASSLRRTLSADMSSKKWLFQNEPASPMKKIASSEELSYSKTIVPAGDSSSSSSEGEGGEEEAERERLEIWSSIQRNKKEEQEKSGQIDYIWSSIMTLKETSKSLPATPYVHPLVKRSKSSLSEKSLEICTESLGSETGSDGFSSSYPSSETGEIVEVKEEAEQDQHKTEKETEHAAYEIEEELQIPTYKYAAKKSLQRSFPPPLPSLSCHQDGPSLHMRPRRDNGRLVLEAISVPSQNNFSVQRQDGRLVLTFATHEKYKEDSDEVRDENEEKGHLDKLKEEEFEGFEEEEDLEEKEHEKTEEDETKDVESTIKEAPVLSSGVTSVERLMMMNKKIGLVNRNPKWPEKFNEVVNLEGEKEHENTEEDETKDVESLIKEAPVLSSGITSVEVLMMMNKQIGLVNRNPKWPEKFNEVVNLEDVKVVEQSPVAQSLPPRPRVARLIPSSPAVASEAVGASFNFNAYEYYWRSNPTSKAGPNPLLNHEQNNKLTLKNRDYSSKLIVSGDINREQQQVLVLRGKNGDYLVHNLKSCKDSRRSFLLWEPYCIATS